jgi:colanic acid biosynthesis glycosyl transferase WcaI
MLRGRVGRRVPASSVTQPSVLLTDGLADSESRGMRVTFLNRYFYPDHAPTGVLLSDVAFALSRQGHEVAVITSRLRYDAADPLPQHETIRGVDVRRVWSSQRGQSGLFGRSLDYGSFYFAASWRLWRLTRRNDLIVAKTDPPLLSVTAALIAKLKGARLVNWLQDIFPEVAETLNIGGPAGIVFKLIRPLRNWSLHSAQTNVVVDSKMAERLETEGIPREKIRVIANWSDGTLIMPLAPAQNELRKTWALEECFVVGYAGNLGRAHDIATIIEAMTALQERAIGSPLDDVARRICFVFVGGGAQLAQLERAVLERRLTNVQTHPYQPRERLAETLGIADVHLVSLIPKLEGLIVPSKFYGVAAAGRPTIFIGSAEGSIARLIRQYDCGFAVASGDAGALVDRILRLANDPELCLRIGARARAAFEEHWDKGHALEQWLQVLKVADEPWRYRAARADRDRASK